MALFKRRSAPADFSAALIEGPWSHRFVAARGLRFHVATTGPEDGRLVVLLHGLPQHWWATRDLLTDLGAAGYRAAAVDLRGCGASDKPPEGYSLPMLAADVAGVITALGRRSAVVVGSGIGGQVAWTMASRAPGALDAIVAIATFHPGSLRPKRQLLVSPRAVGQIGALRSPRLAGRLLPDTAFMSALLGTWVLDPSAMDAAAVGHYAEAMRVPFAPDKAAQIMRWATRPLLNAAHARFVRSARVPAPVPVLQLQSDLDPVLRWQVVRAGDLGGQNYRFELLTGVGHLPMEEDGELVGGLILGWLAEHRLLP
ncbi:MAG: alpha/beta hydrolase [Bifidobacteriaceae bacterium]|nr:alpha/beta hydrolase [Bifidobacteriaceae bacterium]